MDKYQPLRDAHTNGANYDLDTDGVIRHLQDWDAKFGVKLSDAKHDAVVDDFERLPEDVAELAADVYDFCPDTIDQHFGCLAEMLEMAEETGQHVPEELQQLIEGVDFSDENYGLELLSRSLTAHKRVALWWD